MRPPASRRDGRRRFLGGRGELRENRREKALSIDWRAQVAHVAGEHGVELRHELEPAVDCRQLALLGLADLVAHLAVECRPQRVGLRRQRQRHRDLVLLCRKDASVARREVPQLQMLESARRRFTRRRIQQLARDDRRVRERPAVIDEGQRYSEATEDRALEHDDRQNAGNRSAIGGRQVDAFVSERPLEHPPPAPLVIGGRVRMALDVQQSRRIRRWPATPRPWVSPWRFAAASNPSSGGSAR